MASADKRKTQVHSSTKDTRVLAICDLRNKRCPWRDDTDRQRFRCHHHSLSATRGVWKSYSLWHHQHHRRSEMWLRNTTSRVLAVLVARSGCCSLYHEDKFGWEVGRWLKVYLCPNYPGVTYYCRKQFPPVWPRRLSEMWMRRVCTTSLVKCLNSNSNSNPIPAG